MGHAVHEAKRYLQVNEIPKIFEGLMTGLIHNRPADPVGFMEAALAELRADPAMRARLQWDTFVHHTPSPPPRVVLANGNGVDAGPSRNSPLAAPQQNGRPPGDADLDESQQEAQPVVQPEVQPNPVAALPNGHAAVAETAPPETSAANGEVAASTDERPASVVTSSEGQVDIKNDVPVVLFMGGPGVGKTKHAARVAADYTAQNLVHVCAPDLVKGAIARYKDRYPQWKKAAEMYEAGELIPNNLALAVVKAEMKKHVGTARAFLLEGFPRDLQQVKDFEREVKPINLALILDYDEATLKSHMRQRDLTDSVITQRLSEYKQKTLPAAKYFDDQMLLHLIAGEQNNAIVGEQIKLLLDQVLGLGPNLDNQSIAASIPPLHREPEKHEHKDKKKGSATDVPHGLPNNAPVVLVVGAPGMSKSEYCKRLVKKYDGFVHVSAGAMLRRELRKHKEKLPKNGTLSDKWRLAQTAIDAGDLVQSKLVRKLVHEGIHKSSHSKAWGYFIDGYPRTVDQAIDFEQTVGRLDIVLLIDGTEAYCAKQLEARRNKTSSKRSDDTLTATTKRLANFKQHTLLMLKRFEDAKKLVVVRAKPKVDSDAGVESIFPNVVSAVDGALFIPKDNGASKPMNDGDAATAVNGAASASAAAAEPDSDETPKRQSGTDTQSLAGSEISKRSKKSLKTPPIKQEVEEAVQEKKEEVKEAVEEKKEEVKEALEEKKEEVKEAVEEKKEEVKEALEEKKEEVKEVLEEKTEEVKEVVQEKVEKMEGEVEEKVDEVEVLEVK